MTHQQAHSYVGPVILDGSRSHAAGRDSGDLFNDYGFVIRGRTTTGEDFHLWLFTYILRGAEVIIDGDVTQTLLVYGKFSPEEKKSMHDTPFVNKGQNLDDYLPPGTCIIKEEKDQVTWSNGGRIYIGKPPYWHLQGSHAGVKTNLIMEADSDGLYHHGRFEDLDSNSGRAGYLVHAKVTGTIEVNGQTLTLEKAYGVHERILMGGNVPERIQFMMGRGLNWVHGWSDGFSWYVMAGDIGPNGKGYLKIDSELFVVQGVTNVWVEEISHWHDPKTRQLQPHKWHIWMITPKGRLDAILTGYARAYYTWTRRTGTLLVHQSMCDSTSTFTRTDGTVIKSEQLGMMEQMRTLYYQPEYET